MGALAKTFGVLFILFATLLLISGLIAVGYGSVDNQAADEECGIFGSGCDSEREQMNNALIAGGAASTGVGVLFLILGVVLLVAGSRAGQQQQQQVVLSDGSTQEETVVSQQQQTAGDVARNPRVIAAVVGGGLAILLLFVMVGNGGNPAVAIFGDDYPHRLQSHDYDGRLQNTGSASGITGEQDVWQVHTHDKAERVVLWVNWTADDFGPSTLHVLIERVALSGNTDALYEGDVRNGMRILLDDGAVGSLEDIQLHITVGPSDRSFISDQAFTIELSQWDMAAR